MENPENIEVVEVDAKATAKVAPKTVTEDISSTVKAHLVGTGNWAREYIISMEVSDIITKRQEAAKKAYIDLAAKEKELLKVKPDVSTFKKDGTVLTAGYSPAQLEKYTKLAAEIKSLEAMLNDAFKNDKFDKLLEKYGNKQ